MTPIIFTGAPDIEHGGNWPEWIRVKPLGARARRRLKRQGPPPPKIYAIRKAATDEVIHGAAVLVTERNEPSPYRFTVLHTSDDVESWLAAGWRITSY